MINKFKSHFIGKNGEKNERSYRTINKVVT